MKVIQCSTVQGEGGAGCFSSLFLLRWVSETARSLDFGFQQWSDHDPLEQMAARSPSAADRKATNDSENGVQLLYCQRVKIGEKKRLPDNFSE